MKREILLERIDKLKQIMPWYVLEYYQSKLAVPTVLQPCTNTSRNTIDFSAGFWSLVFQMLIKCLTFLYQSWKICLKRYGEALSYIYENDLC